jgi:hypothetical protein
MHSNKFSTITLVCAVVCQALFSIGPSFADNKIPPRCWMKLMECEMDNKSKDPAIAAQCRDQYNNCQKGATISQKGATIK